MTVAGLGIYYTILSTCILKVCCETVPRVTPAAASNMLFTNSVDHIVSSCA